MKLNNVCIRTTDLWYQKQLFWQTSHKTLFLTCFSSHVCWFVQSIPFGEKLKKSFLFRYIFTEPREKKIAGWFHKHGDKSIFLARFAPGLRVAVFFSAGSYRVPFWKFILFDGIAALVSVPIWVWLAYKLSSNLELLSEKLRQFQWGFYIVLGVCLIGGILFFALKKKGDDKI